MGPGVDVGYPFQTTVLEKRRTVCVGNSAKGTIARPSGLVEVHPWKLAATKRIPDYCSIVDLPAIIYATK